MSITYAWRRGFPKPPVEAEVFGAEIEKIKAKLQVETVLAEDIVDAAKDPKSPIRPALQWDDRKAAEAFRLDQARRLLGGLTVVRVQIDDQPAVSNRAMMVVNHEGRRGYVSHDRIVGDRELRKQVVEAAGRELKAFINKYASVLAMGPFIPRLQEVVDTMLDEVERLGTASTERRPPRRQKSVEQAAMLQAAE